MLTGSSLFLTDSSRSTGRSGRPQWVLGNQEVPPAPAVSHSGGARGASHGLVGRYPAQCLGEEFVLLRSPYGDADRPRRPEAVRRTDDHALA